MSVTSGPPSQTRVSSENEYRTPMTEKDAEGDIGLHARNASGKNQNEAHSSWLETPHGPLCRAPGGISESEGSESAVFEPSRGGRSWRKRIRHFTWAHFTLNMATGGLANVLYNGRNVMPWISLLVY